jgi:alkaline phosphatase D
MRTPALLLLLLSTALHAQVRRTTDGGPLDPQRNGLDPALEPFYHGVASGDPEQDRVMLWTRVTTDLEEVMVEWRVALDTAMTDVVASGTTSALAVNDHCVKVDVSGLEPFTFYYYEFEVDGQRSVRGRTRTLPVGLGPECLRLAVVSCSNYAAGWFNAYRRITARNDVFGVVHLGDYIYEYGNAQFGSDRDLEPEYEILTLNDYRIRHSHYKLDPDLMRLHQQYPFFSVWDDHETANDAWSGGAQNHNAGEGDWFERKSAGIRAYAEWMPLRLPDPQDTLRIYRGFTFGDLVDLHMLDTRLIARDQQTLTTNNAPERNLIGPEQLDWLTQRMTTSTARWQVLGQQVMMAPLVAFGLPVNQDQWDGYPAERQRIYDLAMDPNVQNLVVLTGDIHTSWGNDLPMQGYSSSTGANSAGVEFVTTSVTSTSFDLPVPAFLIQLLNGHVKNVDLTRKGYLVVDFDSARVQGDWYYVQSVSQITDAETYGAGRSSLHQSRRLTNANAPAIACEAMIGVPAPLAPRPNNSTSIAARRDGARLVGAYPNPFLDHVDVQYFAPGAGELTLLLFDHSGKLVARGLERIPAAGVHNLRFAAPGLAPGNYVLRLEQGGHQVATRLVRVL